MAKKNAAASPEAPATKSKRTPLEKAERKSQKASKRVAKASKGLTDEHAEKKVGQKQTLKAAAKQLQKELDARMQEVVTRIRKETKAKLKEVIKDATSRLDVDTERMFEQALQTLVRYYDAAAPSDATPTTSNPATADASAPAASGAKAPIAKSSSPRKAKPAAVAAAPTPAPRKGAGRPTGSASKSTSSPGPGRPKRQPADNGALELSTSVATTNDGVAVDNV